MISKTRFLVWAWSIVILSLLILMLLIKPAPAADVFSAKDSIARTAPVSAGPIDPSGFWISGIAGMTWGNREITRTIDRSLGLDISNEGLQMLPADGPDDGTDVSAEEAAAFLLQEANIPSTPTAEGLSIPLAADRTRVRGDTDIDSPFFGVGASYLHKRQDSSWGFEIGLDAIFYTDAESSLSHSGAVGNFTGGTALANVSISGDGQTFNCTNMATCAGDPSPFPQSGFVTIEREMDLDLVPEIHWFLGPQFSVAVGVGPSLAKASANGHNSTDAITAPGRQFATSVDDEDWSLGLAAKASINYYASNRFRITAFGGAKWHEFEFDGASNFREPIGGNPNFTATGSARDKITADDELWMVGIRAAIKLGGAE